MGRNSGIKWGKVDWRLRDVDIAENFGCSRERVRQVRKALGKPKSPIWHKRMDTVVDGIRGMDTSRKLPVQVAKEVGCGTEYALQVLKALGKPFVKPPDLRRRHKYAWDSIKLSEWNGMTDVLIAEKLGVKNPAVVTQWRRRKGIVKTPDQKMASRVKMREAVQ